MSRTHKFCNGCSMAKPLTEFYKSNTERSDGYQARCKECHTVYRQTPKAQAGQLAYGLKLVDDAIAAYGGKCACCGETERKFLTIDHIGGWGAEHRRVIGASGRNTYAWLRRNNYPKEGFQLLCFNCNCAEGLRGGCPHKDKKELDD